jgi:nanoRNase/pAp phosphatase (c-di-AMP/oligoRNAs hydrolase)
MSDMLNGVSMIDYVTRRMQWTLATKRSKQLNHVADEMDKFGGGSHLGMGGYASAG